MQNPYIALLATAWRYAERSQRLKIVLIYSLFFLANATMAVIPFLFGWFINGVQRSEVDILSQVWLYAAAYIGLVLVQWSFHKPARIIERRLAFQISENFLGELFHQITRLPMTWHKDRHSGGETNRIRKAYTALRQFFESGFMFFQTVTQVVISTMAMLYFSPLFGVMAIGIGVVAVWVNYKFDKPVIRNINEFNEAEHKVSATLADILSNILTVITLRTEKLTHKELHSKVKQMFPPYLRLARLGEWKWFTLNMFVVVIYLVVLVGYIYTHYRPGEPFLLGNMITLMGFVTQFTTTFYAVGNQYTNLIQYNTDVQTVKSVQDAYRQMSLPADLTPLPAHWSVMKIEQLTFSYEKNGLSHAKPSGRRGLDAIELELKRGQRIAIIGKSGAGKSTLLALLRGLYLPASGVKVVADGKARYTLASVAETSTLFPQDPEIFENTVRYNITLGLPFDQIHIDEACRISCFADVINELPEGMETDIKEKGVNLSGGQKQRLALARGILAAGNSDIILLDEPTNRIDTKTEMEIYQKLFAAFSDKTILCSTHNMGLLSDFDYVYHILDGAILDEGPPEKFMVHS